jgi:hypothetical protein
MAELSQKLQRVREIVKQKIEQYNNGKSIARESILMEGNSYAGHRFHGGKFLAQWLLADDRIQIFVEKKMVEELDLNTNISADDWRKAA